MYLPVFDGYSYPWSTCSMSLYIHGVLVFDGSLNSYSACV